MTLDLRSWFVFPDGHEQLSNDYVLWSTDSEHATVSATGILRSVSVGPVTVTARFDDLVGAVATSVPETELASLRFTAEDPSGYLLPGGYSWAFLYATFSNGATFGVNEGAWFTSSDPDRFVVDPHSGKFFPAHHGIYEVTATFLGMSRTVDYAVDLGSYPTFVSEVTLSVGESRDLAAMATYRNGDPVDLARFVDWSSQDEGVVSVSNERGSEGRIRGVSVGDVFVTAYYSGSNPIRVVVTP